jgi:hypothetical protein
MLVSSAIKIKVAIAAQNMQPEIRGPAAHLRITLAASFGLSRGGRMVAATLGPGRYSVGCRQVPHAR